MWSRALLASAEVLRRSLNKRFDFLARGIQVLDGGLYLRAIFFDHAARVRESGGKIFAVLGR